MSKTYQIHVLLNHGWHHILSLDADYESDARRQALHYIPKEHANKPIKLVLQEPSGGDDSRSKETQQQLE